MPTVKPVLPPDELARYADAMVRTAVSVSKDDHLIVDAASRRTASSESPSSRRATAPAREAVDVDLHRPAPARRPPAQRAGALRRLRQPVACEAPARDARAEDRDVARGRRRRAECAERHRPEAARDRADGPAEPASAAAPRAREEPPPLGDHRVADGALGEQVYPKSSPRRRMRQACARPDRVLPRRPGRPSRPQGPDAPSRTLCGGAPGA